MRHHPLLNRCLFGLMVGVAPIGSVNAQPADAGPPVEITGELEVLYADDFENQRAELLHFIKDRQTGKRLQLRFDGPPPGHLRSGSVVRARGRPHDDELFLAADGEDSQSVTVVQAESTVVTGDQKTLVMVANLRDANVSCSVDTIRDIMFTDPGNQSIDDLYRESSFGLVSLSGQVVGPYSIDYNNDSCELDGWSSAADAAARANGIDVDAYDRKVYVLPGGACRAAGYGSVLGNPTRAWILSCDFRDTYAHELGHNLGMAHASKPGCEYCDITDFMGTGNNKLRHNNAPHKDQMGWLQGTQLQTITQSGTYDIAPLEPQPVNTIAPQTLKILKADTNEYYYLSYRRAIGFDTSLSPISQLDRLAVHRARGDGSGGNTYLLAQLADGESYADSANDFSVKPVSHNTDYVTVEVSLNGSGSTPICTTEAPTLNLTPASQSAQPGDPLDYAVSLSNKDSAACAQSTFALGHSAPSGWTVSVSPSTLDLAPGQSGSATLSVISATGANAASYAVTASASDSAEAGHSTSASATYVVTSQCTAATPQVALTPASQRANAGTMVQYTLAVTNADGAGCSPSSFDLTRSVPSGWTGSVSPSSLSLAPGETLQATYSVASASSSGQGVYSVALQATDGADPSRTIAESALYEVQVSSADTTPPTAPTGLTASAKRKQVNLSWNASKDNVAVTGYEVWRDGVRLGKTTEASFADRAISSGAGYTYFVVAFDAAGNTSPASNTLAITVGNGGGKTSSDGGGNGGGKTSGDGGGNGGGKGKKP